MKKATILVVLITLFSSISLVSSAQFTSDEPFSAPRTPVTRKSVAQWSKGNMDTAAAARLIQAFLEDPATPLPKDETVNTKVKVVELVNQAVANDPAEYMAKTNVSFCRYQLSKAEVYKGEYTYRLAKNKKGEWEVSLVRTISETSHRDLYY